MKLTDGPRDGVEVGDFIGAQIVMPIPEECGCHFGQARYDRDGRFVSWSTFVGRDRYETILRLRA